MSSDTSNHHPIEYVVVGALMFGTGYWLKGGVIASMLGIFGGLMFLGGLGMLIGRILASAFHRITRNH